MIAGHFGFAAIIKAREQTAPLWILMFASVWLDIVFVPLFLAGVETLSPVDGRSGYGRAIIHADYTHSLFGMLILSAILGAVCWPRWGRRSAIVIGLVAASHWLLDLVVHRADMPISPKNLLELPRLGLGLWRFPMIAAALEGALVLIGAWAYWGAAKSICVQNNSRLRLASVVAVMIAACGILVLALDFTS